MPGGPQVDVHPVQAGRELAQRRRRQRVSAEVPPGADDVVDRPRRAPPRSRPARTGTRCPARCSPGRSASSASALTFGNEELKSTSAPQFITITNSGKSEIILNEVTSSAADFRLVHNCALAPDPMPAGGSCGISIRFVPNAVGLRNGNIKITIAGDRQVQPLTIPLQGNGIESPVSLSQTYLVFRTLLVGMTSMPQFVRLTNHSSTDPARITSITASPDFALATTTAQCVAGITLAPLASCTVAVVWTPTDSGSRSGQVTIAGSDAASPHIIDLQATATGIRLSSATLRWNPTAVGLTGDSQTVEVKNEGRTSIEIGSIEASGDFYQQNTCGKELIQHESCSVTVLFQPTAEGKRVGTILIHDSDATGDAASLPDGSRLSSRLVPGKDWTLAIRPRRAPARPRQLPSPTEAPPM